MVAEELIFKTDLTCPKKTYILSSYQAPRVGDKQRKTQEKSLLVITLTLALWL